MKMDDDNENDDDIAAAVFAGKRAGAAERNPDDQNLEGEMYASLKQKYEALQAEHREQDKNINF